MTTAHWGEAPSLVLRVLRDALRAPQDEEFREHPSRLILRSEPLASVSKDAKFQNEKAPKRRCSEALFSGKKKA